MKSQLKIKKIVAVVLYRFVHGFNLKHMLDRFDVGACIIRKICRYNLGRFCNIE
jgi:hypothetical protein